MDIPTFEDLAAYWTGHTFETNIVIILNLVGALLLGLVVGYERSYHGRAAGMRTYGLVCMASAALTVIAGYPGYWYGNHAVGFVNSDPTRVIQGIVTGIGFLGAGIIMKDGLNISGLTTAASIWTTSAIGVLVGVGFYGSAISLAVFSAVFMMWGWKLESLLPARHALAISLSFKKDYKPTKDAIQRIATQHGYDIAKGSISITNREGRAEWKFVMTSLGRSYGAPIVELAHQLPAVEALESFNISHARN